MDVHTIDRSGVGPVAQTLAAAFFDDPVWGWAFPDPAARLEQHAALWGLMIEGAVDHGWVWTTAHHEAATLWVPPGEAEMAEPYASQLEPLLGQLAGEGADVLEEVFARFDAAHPHDEPYFYLSLLGCHPDHRGHGIGMDLLRQNLALIDESHFPAYLESTNPANLARYGTVGFEAIGEFELPSGGPAVTRMWRVAC